MKAYWLSMILLLFYSLFYKHCYDPMQYTELDLQPYWMKVMTAAKQWIDSLWSQFSIILLKTALLLVVRVLNSFQ